MLGGIEDESGAGTEQGTGLCGDEGAVGKFDGGRRLFGYFLPDLGCNSTQAVVRRDACLFHQQGYLVHFFVVAVACRKASEGGIVTADDFVAGGIAAGVFIGKAVSNHVYAHVGGGLVWILTVDAFEEGVEDGENLDVAVVVDGRGSVCLKMEGVDHVHVVEICGCGLVRNVYRVLEGKVPDGEGLKLGVSGLDAAFHLLVELAQAHCHFSAARAGSRNNYQRAGGLHIAVLAETLFRVDQGHVFGISFDGMVVVDGDTHALQTGAVGVCAGLAVVVGDHHAAHQEASLHELVTEAEDVHVVGDAKVAADFVLLNVHGADDYDYFTVVAELLEHFELGVRLETGEHPCCVIVVEKFTTELHVELVAEHGDALLDVLRLDFEIFLNVEPVFHNGIQR